MRILFIVLPLLLATLYGCTGRNDQSTAQTVKELKNQTQELSAQLDEQQQATQQAQAAAENAANDAQDAQDQAQDAQDDAEDALEDATQGRQPMTQARADAIIRRAQAEAKMRCAADAQCECRQLGWTWVEGKLSVGRGAHGEPAFSAKSKCVPPRKANQSGGISGGTS